MDRRAGERTAGRLARSPSKGEWRTDPERMVGGRVSLGPTLWPTGPRRKLERGVLWKCGLLGIRQPDFGARDALFDVQGVGAFWRDMFDWRFITLFAL